MTKTQAARYRWTATFFTLAVTTLTVVALAAEPNVKDAQIVKEVGHELRSLAYYGVFDDITYSVKDRIVTLQGSVTQPQTKNSAGTAAKSVEGVEKVDNKIEVLPVSAQDDRVRLAAYNAIYGHPTLNRYALNSRLPIRIVVKNGDIRILGDVATELDKNLVGTQVNSVPGAHSVKNDLTISKN